MSLMKTYHITKHNLSEIARQTCTEMLLRSILTQMNGILLGRRSVRSVRGADRLTDRRMCKTRNAMLGRLHN